MILPVAHNLSSLSLAATGGLMSAIWQGILLAAAAALGLRLLPKTPAAVRFAIWFAVFLVVAGLPMLTLLPHAAGATSATTHAPWLTINPSWAMIIAVVWATASLVRAWTLVLAGFRVRSLWKRATPVEVPGAALAVGTRQAAICTSDEVDRPTVIGFFSPKILIPGWLLEKLTADELEQVVLHESGHLGRADDWLNLVQKIALVLFPLNPALAWVERRLCFERELAVDERVLAALTGRAGAATAYAACLATLAEHRLGRRGFALALGALGRESELGRRVGRILRRGERMKPLHAKLVLGGAMLSLVGGAVALERCPQVVGFAPAAETQLASQERQSAPVHSSRVALNRVTAYHVVAAHKYILNNRIDVIQHAPHEVLTVASPAASDSHSTPDAARQAPASSGSPRMIRTMASTSAKPTRMTSDAAPSSPASGVIQWIEVTSWQSPDGARVVMTRVRTAQVPATIAPAPAADAVHQRTAQQPVYPYAAVPVGDGWLVFQL